MSHMYYPVALDLVEKRCLVAGGGKVATEKVEGLLAAGARVVVVTPEASEHLLQLAEEGRIELHLREYRPSDLDGVYLAYGATDDLAVNASVTHDARDRGILANAVDDIPNCDFFAMAITRRGDLQVAVSTNGGSPALARWVREYLDESLPPELGDLLAVLADVRRQIKSQGPVPPYESWKSVISDEVLLRLRRGDRIGAREQVWQALTESRRDAAEALQPAGAGRGAQ